MPSAVHTPPPAHAPAPAAAKTVATRVFGRFQLRDLLGRSRRTMLWVAYDPRVGQEMLLTLPRIAPPDPAALEQWLIDAKRASRLLHPHLAPVVEVGTHDHWPYSASDRALGVSLAEFLSGAATPPQAELARWWAQALEGLAFAHDAGLAHGDIQLHNLLIDERGNLRVLGLGVGAEPVRDGGLGDSKGMPMDPARLREQRHAAERDVLAIGILAHQLLAGEAALGEPDLMQVADRLAPIGRDQLRLPWTLPQPISDALRAIVNRATHQFPRQRYLNARTLQQALERWRAADAQDTGGPVAVLLQRLASVGHLPALPGVTATVSRLSRMERQRTAEIAEQVLLDLALSIELLRQINTAQVQGTQVSGNGPVLTIRRAVAMLGLDGVRHAAHGLRAWPGPLSDSAAGELQALMQRVRLAGHLAQRLRPAGYDPEVMFLIGVLQNLGRLVLQYHFPEDAREIFELMSPLPAAPEAGPAAHPAAKPPAEHPGMSEQAACYAVLGVDIDALGSAAARHCGLNDEVLHMIRRLPLERPVHHPDNDGDLLRAAASAANEVLDAVTWGGQRSEAMIEAVAKRYGRLLGVTARDLHDALRSARHARDHSAPLLADDEAGTA